MSKYKGIAPVAVTAVAVLTASGFVYTAYKANADEKNRLANELVALDGRLANLKFEMYERSSNEPLNGKPLIVSMIVQAIEIEGLDWNADEIEAMATICWRESRYNPNGQHPYSSAYGLYQFLDSTWQYYDVEKTSDPLLQTVAAIRYIEDRYETPVQALAFHQQLHAIDGRLVHYY